MHHLHFDISCKDRSWLGLLKEGFSGVLGFLVTRHFSAVSHPGNSIGKERCRCLTGVSDTFGTTVTGNSGEAS
jgi:hypothetical protein